MSPKSIAVMLRKLRSEQNKLAKTRDALREAMSEFETVLDDVELAKDALDDAIEALSRLQ